MVLPSFDEDNQHAIIAASLLLYVGVCANLGVLVSLSKSWKKCDRAQFFIFHLCIADLLSLFLMFGVEIGWHATVSWEAGNTWCKLLMFLVSLGIFLAHFLLAGFSLDNLLESVIRSGRNIRKYVLLSIAWVMSIGICTPRAVMYREMTHPVYEGFHQCVSFEFFKSPMQELIYGVMYIVIIFWLPLQIIIIFNMWALILWLKNRARSKCGADHDVLGQEIFLTIAYGAVFFLCWTPTSVVSLWLFNNRQARLDGQITRWLFYFGVSNSCLNPFVYGVYVCLQKRRKQSPDELEPSPVIEDDKDLESKSE